MKKRVTLKDIGEKVGLAPASVSKALRDSGEISPATIQKVKEAAKEMGYYPNITARNLVSKKSFIIGVLIPEILTSFHSHVVNGMYEQARSRGYEIILMVTNENQANENHCLRYLASLPVDGIIATVTEETTDFSAFEEINESGTPVVFLGRDVPESKIPILRADDYRWTSTVMDFFLEEGYQKIAFLGPQEPLYSSIRKYQAYQDKLENAGIPFDKKLVRYCKINEKDGYLKTKEMLDCNIHPEAVICANDMVAVGVAKAFLDAGFSIPKDVAIAGFGNLMEASMLNVPISTVDYNPEKTGELATNHIIDRLEQKSKMKLTKPEYMEASMVIRK